MVRIELALTEGQVRAALHAEHESVRNLLHHQIHQLRHALESHGLGVERLTVQTTQGGNTSSTTQQQQQGGSDEGRSRGAFDQSTPGGQQPADDGEPGPDNRLGFQENFEEVA